MMTFEHLPPEESAEQFESRVSLMLEPQRPPSALHWHGEIDDAPLKEWLVDRILPRVGKALIAGQWGSYKTFVALDLCRAVMTKGMFAGRAVRRQGGVLFIAAEGQDEVRVRLEGLAREKLGEPELDTISVDPAHLPFAWLESCPRLTADDAQDQLAGLVAEAEAEMQRRHRLPLALVIIDTLMPAANFKDANDASEAQRVMSVLTAIALKFGVLVLAVDHFGKNASTGTRNSSVKEDAVDAVLALLAERSVAGKVTNSRMAIRKVRGAATGEEIPFSTRVVVVAQNAGFDAVTTLVIDWGVAKEAGEAATEAKPATGKWPFKLKPFHKALKFVLADTGKRRRPFPDGPEVLVASREQVKTEFLNSCPGDSRKIKLQAFRRSEKGAIELGLVMFREIESGDERSELASFFWLHDS